MGAICNGRLAGGGQNLAPNALLNDGLLDVVLVKHFPPHTPYPSAPRCNQVGLPG
ncbi:hypothetical protein [Shewanella benthica]|uniref:hypothetical protein n=1 Tax=Shewanella benthica TaxID=43661 RepID=UPI001E2A8BE0|nr:hypothetical protein [Shewanella benthica]